MGADEHISHFATRRTLAAFHRIAASPGTQGRWRRDRRASTPTPTNPIHIRETSRNLSAWPRSQPQPRLPSLPTRRASVAASPWGTPPSVPLASLAPASRGRALERVEPDPPVPPALPESELDPVLPALDETLPPVLVGEDTAPPPPAPAMEELETAPALLPPLLAELELLVPPLLLELEIAPPPPTPPAPAPPELFTEPPLPPELEVVLLLLESFPPEPPEPPQPGSARVHAPAPSQVRQLPQPRPNGKAQAPTPSQLDLHEPVPWPHSLSGSEPATWGVQVPMCPARLQALHEPVQAPSQQTPSTQKPEAQPLAAVQA